MLLQKKQKFYAYLRLKVIFGISTFRGAADWENFKDPQGEILFSNAYFEKKIFSKFVAEDHRK